MSIKSIAIGGRSDIKKVTLGDGVLFEKAAPTPSYTWDAVLASIAAGTYSSTYHVGDLIPIDLGTEGAINMQIAAFDADDRADGMGKAHITFVSKELLVTSHRMNPALTPSSAPYNEGTGTIGGWEKSEMRTYLKNTIKPLIPSEVLSAIIEVTKTHTAYGTYGSSFTQTTQDDVWIPAQDEIIGSSAKYATLFPDATSRKKYKVSTSGFSNWWTLQAATNKNFFRIDSGGDASGTAGSNSYGVALGFCL